MYTQMYLSHDIDAFLMVQPFNPGSFGALLRSSLESFQEEVPEPKKLGNSWDFMGFVLGFNRQV